MKKGFSNSIFLLIISAAILFSSSRAEVIGCSKYEDEAKTICLDCLGKASLNSQGACTLCSDAPGCKTCDESESKCLTCIEDWGYYLNGDKCETCGDNCTSCKDGKCAGCAVGFGFDSENAQCNRCEASCLECGADSQCSACNPGMELQEVEGKNVCVSVEDEDAKVAYLRRGTKRRTARKAANYFRRRNGRSRSSRRYGGRSRYGGSSRYRRNHYNHRNRRHRGSSGGGVIAIAIIIGICLCIICVAVIICFAAKSGAGQSHGHGERSELMQDNGRFDEAYTPSYDQKPNNGGFGGGGFGGGGYQQDFGGSGYQQGGYSGNNPWAGQSSNQPLYGYN